ncbi:MAG: DNA double-strand break repair nuclease NurA [Chloroflexi bacterium]|nr:DNA double-strand break repair nuclease NurA [Chloroflexota bacterium]
MSLDLSKVVGQVGGMLENLKAGTEERQKHLRSALDVLYMEPVDLNELKKKVSSAKTTWLVAGLVEGLAQHYEAPSLSAEFTVIATDGSHIDVDRHQSTRCYLINIGSVLLHYGARPDAILDSSPQLYAEEKDLLIAPPDGKGREQMVEGGLLGVKRSVEECRVLAEMAEELPAGSPALALLDGSLILWGLEAYPEFVTDILLHKGYLLHMEEMRKLSSEKRLALASYISYPRSTDVVNTLRVALCPNNPPDCDRYCTIGKRDCDAVAGVQDRELFASLLGRGERSALFISQSSVVEKHYGEHEVYFFYLNADEEIARVEIPQWVAKDKGLVDITHALVLDQCKRGQGYPVALSEAHEQAVVTGADRENFWQLVESSLVEDHLPTPTSAKSRSKRTRWV